MPEQTYTEWRDYILSHFPNHKKTPKGYQVICPGHEDKQASLSILFNNDSEKAIFCCHAGCTVNRIVSAVGLKVSDLFFSSNGNHPFPQKQSFKKISKKSTFIDIDFENPTEAYSYTDEQGVELYQNCRYERSQDGQRIKTFRQRQRQGETWLYSLNGVRRVPYNLPKLLLEPNMIFDCEGEKDAKNLTRLGCTATSTLKEAFKELQSFCKDKGIIVCEDNDESGRKKALEKAEAYWKSGASFVKILTFHDLPQKSDVTDWIEADATSHDIFALHEKIDSIPDYNPLASVTINFFREITPRSTLIRIDSQKALPSGNIGGIVAGIGQGKSHFMEILASLAICDTCEPDSCISISLEDNNRVALLDTERTGDDCKDTLLRAWRRVGEDPKYLTHDKSEFLKFVVITLTELDIADRREKLVMVIERLEYKLILIDGLLDFVSNPNDTVECSAFISWLFAMAVKHDKGIFCTIHGNRDQTTGKAKGWLGDLFQRKASCFLMLRKHQIDPTIRIITTDFDNVKMRHGDDTGINIAIQWDLDFHGFRCLPYPDEEKGRPSKETLFSLCFAEKDRMLKKELVNTYMSIGKVSKGTAYRHIDSGKTLLCTEQIGSDIFYSLAG